jgi:hypothetical protein
MIHIKDVLLTGLFIDYRMSRMLFIDDTDGLTYSIQYRLESLDKLRTYQDHFASDLQKDHVDRYGEKVVAFRSVMEVVNDGAWQMD